MQHTEAHESAGTDSFLDVTTNIVGILIILVMVVAIRAQNPIANAAAVQESEEKVAGLRRQAAATEYDVRRIADQMEQIEKETAVQTGQCETLATMVVTAEHEIKERRAKFDSSKQEDFDLRRQLEEGRTAIAQGETELQDLKSQKPPVEEVKHYPTPISKTVLGHEIHFQLLGSRITYVPMDEFIDDVRADMRRSGMDISNLTDKVGVVGPRNGYELRYTVDVVTERGRGIVGIATKEFQLVPVGVQPSETLKQALSDRSEFRTALASHSPHDTTITLWTYPDSFEEYRVLKEELHNLGYATAGRPLPMGVLIGGSSHGTKSSAQ